MERGQGSLPHQPRAAQEAPSPGAPDLLTPHPSHNPSPGQCLGMHLACPAWALRSPGSFCPSDRGRPGCWSLGPAGQQAAGPLSHGYIERGWHQGSPGRDLPPPSTAGLQALQQETPASLPGQEVEELALFLDGQPDSTCRLGSGREKAPWAWVPVSWAFALPRETPWPPFIAGRAGRVGRAELLTAWL